MTPLSVPPPQLSWKDAGAPQIEQPVEVKLPALRYADGVEASDAEMQKAGAYLYRHSSAGEELWNESEQRWGPAPPDPTSLPPLPFAYKKGDPLPWQGTLVAIGQQDKDGQDRFAKAAGGEPRYRLRAYVRFTRDGVDYAGLSAPSDELAFVSGLDNQRFVVDMKPDAKQTDTVMLALKNASLAIAGYLKISTPGGQAVEVASCDAAGNPLAVMQLAADGSIHLRPAAGRTIVLEGDLEAQHVRYQPAAGGPAKDL